MSPRSLISLLLVSNLLHFVQPGHSDEWWTREIVYQVYPRSFRDTNGDGVGDIPGVIEKLDYISELGVKAVWLSPVYPSPMADFGYDISNHTSIDEIFGTMADLDRLVKEAHRRGMYIVMDFVPNHTSDQHPWFLASRGDPRGPYGDFYVWKDCEQPANDGDRPGGVNNWLSSFGGSSWQFDPVRGQCYLHQFCKEQPDLNFTNPAVRTEMSSIVRFWLEKGIDGLRVDAIRHMFEDPEMRDEPVAAGKDWRTNDPTDYHYLKHIYTTDYNETYDVIAEWREIIDQVANATGRQRLLVAEAYSDIPELMRYYRWRGRRLADFPFNFGLLTASSSRGSSGFCDAGCLHSAAARFLDNMPPGTRANWVLGNHDNARMASRFPPEKRNVKALNTLLLTLPGTPTCYYGDELGMVDLRLEADQMVDPLGRRFPEQSRDPARAPMLWSEEPHAGFTDEEATPPWLPVEPGFADKCVSRQARMPNSTLSAFKEVAALRRREEFVWGALEFLLVTPAVLVYRRGSDVKGYIIALYISQSSSDTLLIDLNTHCRSVQPVVDMRAANRNDFSVNSVAMQPGDVIIVETVDCSGGQIKPRISRQHTEL